MSRTPAEHRAAVEGWRSDAPANDSDIMPKTGQTTAPLSQFAEGLRAWLNRPIGIADPEPEQAPPIGTNWRIVPDDNHKAPTDGFGIASDQQITPSYEEIERAIANVTFTYRKEPQSFEKRKRHEEAIPHGGDIERNDDGVIIRIGRLTFSDGTQHERATVLDPVGKVIDSTVRMPKGAMLRSSDRSTRAVGATPAPDARNRYFAEMLGTDPARYIAGKRRSRPVPCPYPNPPLPPTSLSYAEARAWAGLPPVSKAKPGLPCGSPRIADSFIGMCKTTCGGGGSQAWQDVATMIEERETWRDAMAKVSDKTVEVLEATVQAQSLTEVGTALGQSVAYADKNGGGRRALRAANDNILRSLAKYA